ncbi:ABC transporter permease [Rhodobacteraceae bacterium CCMM004]|nr:ABC transporter permease [Rhodobacteraceae bacterium CCMM004]
MRALERKLLRDLGRLWAQALAIAAVLGCGVAVLIMALGVSDALDRSRAAYYERNAFADIFASVRRAPLTILPEIRALSGVRAAEARVSEFVVLDMPGRQRPATAQVVTLPEGRDTTLNRPTLTFGRLPNPDHPEEVVVGSSFGEAHGLRSGDTFAANIGGSRRELTVVGAALSPEFIYTIGPGSMMPDAASHGVIWMGQRAAEAAFNMTGAFDDLVLGLDMRTDERAVIEALDLILEPYGNYGVHGRAQQISHSFLDAEIEQLRVMAYVLPPVFLLITVFLVNMVIGRIVALERLEIGLLKATGYSDGAILAHYLLLAGLVAAVGIVLGSLGGTYLSRWMAGQFARFYEFPELIHSVSWTTHALAAIAGFAAATVGAVRAALSAARLPPAVAMAPAPPPHFNRGVIDRALDAVRMATPDLMIARSITRWPLRAATSLLGYALATSVLVASNFFPDSLDRIIDLAFDQSNRQDAILTFPSDVPDIAVEEIRKLPGVIQAEGNLSMAATLRHGHLEKDATLQGLSADADLARVVGENGVIAIPDRGLVLSDRLAETLEARTGDLIELDLPGHLADPVFVTVAAQVPQVLGLGAYMSPSAINAMLDRAPAVSAVNVTLAADEAAAFHAAVKTMPGLGGAILLADNRRSFEKTVAENIGAMTTIYILLGSAIAVGVAYNAARIQLSERARELASLRILGFGRGDVSWVLIGEAMILVVCAQPLGWWIGYQIAALMTRAFSSDLYVLPLVVQPATFAMASLVVILAAFGSVMLVRRRVDRLDLVAVMKSRE